MRPRWGTRNSGLVGLASAAGIGCVLALGCAANPPITRLTFVTTESGVLAPRILRPAVEGRACFHRDLVTALATPPWRARRADHGRAIAAALRAAPGANVLVNANLRVEIRQYLLFSRVCAIATGAAGVAE